MGALSADMNAYVMGFFLSLSIVNVWENTATFLKRKTKLDGLQCLSSICQLMNLIVHLILNTAKNIHCDHAVNAETFFFYFMQLGTGFVIIYRATAIVTKHRRRNIIRYGLAITLATSVGFNLASDILREMEVIEGTCVPVFQRQLNDISKIILAVVYMGLFAAFIGPVVYSIKRAGRYIDTSTLRDVATITAIKISSAIVVLLVTVILSIVGVFGAYFWIQFTVQNFAMVWASTVASRTIPNSGSTGLVSSHSKRPSPCESANNKVWSYQMPSRSYDPISKPHAAQIP